METLLMICLAALIIGCVIAVLYDLGYLVRDPAKMKRRLEVLRLADEERQRRADQNAQQAARQRQEDDCRAARAHLRQFHAAHRDLLGEAFPPSLMTAFIQAEMGDGLPASQLWTVCLKKISDLLPLVARGRKGQVRLQQIDAEIGACHERIKRLERAGQDEEERAMSEDEIAGQRQRIRQLETQRQVLLTLKNQGDA